MTQEEQIKEDKQRKLDHYREENRNIVPGQIVLTGSSLMEMFPVNKLLNEIGSNKIVYNRAIGGYVTSELSKVLDVCVFALKPSRIFINIGTNDLSDSRIPLSQVIANYDSIITAIETALPKAEIYLMAYYPVNYDAAADYMKPCLEIRNNDKINAANEEVRKLADLHNERYIDINDKLKDDKGRLKAEYTLEGLHLNEQGYRAIFSDFMHYVTEASWK